MSSTFIDLKEEEKKKSYKAFNGEGLGKKI